MLFTNHELQQLAHLRKGFLNATDGLADYWTSEERLTRLKDTTAILWVEPSQKPIASRLLEVREMLRKEFHLVSPCPHQQRCGMLAPEHARHWCPLSVGVSSHSIAFDVGDGIKRRLFVRNAVNCAKSPNQIRAINALHAPRRKTFLQTL